MSFKFKCPRIILSLLHKNSLKNEIFSKKVFIIKKKILNILKLTIVNVYINYINKLKRYKIMRLLMIESDAKGIWYFTGLQECANFLNVSYNSMRMWNMGVTKTCKGFKSIKWIESDDVLSRYINPSREKYIELYGEK